MFEALGRKYYIDVDKIIEKCRPDYGLEKEDDDNKEQQFEINAFKFECYKSCLERVLTEYQGEDDEDVAQFTNKSTNPSFAIAFNTLEKNEILTEDD